MLKSIAKVLTGLTVLSVVLIACNPGGPPATTVPQEKVTVAIPKANWEIEWQQLAEEAKKEGKLMIYSTPGSDIIREIGRAFYEKFGVEVESVNARGEELARRMEVEKNAGLYLVDVVMSGGPTLIVTMKPKGLLGRLEPLLFLPEVLDAKAWVTGSIPYTDKERTALGMVAVYNRFLLRNTDLVREGELTSYKDVLNAKWKGKVVLNDPTVTGSGSAFFTVLAVNVWGLEQTKEFMRQLVKQEPAITRDRRLQGEWIARGKYPLSIGANNETVTEFLKVGSPIAHVKVPEGGNVSPGAASLGVTPKGPHPNAARLFVNWILSREGHARFIKIYGNPGARRDAPREGLPPELFADPDEKVYPDTEESVLMRAEMLNISREIFAPLLK